MRIEASPSWNATIARLKSSRRSRKPLTPLYTVSEVAEYLQVSPSTVYRMIQDGRLSGVRVGHGIRFTPDNLAQMIEENALESW